MRWFQGVGLAGLCLVVCSFAIEAGGGKDKDKKEEKKKFEVPKTAIAGTVKAVDMDKASFTLTIDKKARVFLVDKATEFWGPKGGDRGTGPAGLKDDCMAVGYEIRVVATADGKTAKDVYLPMRKHEEKKEEKKKADKAGS